MSDSQHFIEGEAGPLLPGGVIPVATPAGTVLVEHGVPGDRLSIVLAEKRRGVQRGSIVKVLAPGAMRIEPPCPVAGQCGGCALQSVSLEDQAKIKSGWVRDAFSSLIDAETEWLPAVADSERKRRRLRWSVGHDASGYYLGFKASASHAVVRQTACMAITDALNELRVNLEASYDLSGWQAVQAVQLTDGVHLIVEADEKPDVDVDLTPEAGGLPVQWWWRDSKGITRPMRKPVVTFHDRLPACESDVELAVGPDDFVQGQAEGNRELIATIQAWSGKPRLVADLFCGIGNLSLPLAAAVGATIHGAELNPASIRAAAANAKRLQLDAEFVVANLFENFELIPYINADLLILDPPRRGAKRICQRMLQLLPGRIIMVSCDPAAGARDGVMLKEAGYRMQKLKALDLFPGAGHVEAMSLWVKA